MVEKITNEKFLKVIGEVKDAKARAVMLKNDCDLCTVKFLQEHEEAFRSVIPDYFDRFKDEYRYFGTCDDGIHYVVGKDNFLLYACLQHSIIDPDDFTSVVNFASVGGNLDESIFFFSLNSTDIFKDGLLKLKDGDKKLIEFVDKNPKYLFYFLPLICSVDSDVFSQALTRYIVSSGLEDSIRVRVFQEMLRSSDEKMLARCLDEIESNNYYRFKAMNDASVMIGDYSVCLAPKELVAVLRDVVDNRWEKYLNANFKQAYHFISACKRVYKDKFRDFAIDAFERATDKTRWALFYLLPARLLNGEYARYVYSSKLKIDDLSIFVNKIHGDQIRPDDIPIVFERLFDILNSMDKLNYHFKIDDDVTFARDLSKAMMISTLGDIAIQVNDDRYVKRLDGIYDTLKEEAQAYYLCTVKERTTLDTRQCAIKFLKTDNYTAQKYFDKQNVKLNYDEAVSVSDYLKSKKESVKSKIVKMYLKSKDSDKIEQYLLSCKEDYKVAVGEEMKKSRGKVDDKKLKKKDEYSYFGNESVFIVERPDGEIKSIANQKIDVKPLQIIEYKRLKAFFEALGDFIQANKDYEYASDLSEGLKQFGSNFERLKDTEVGSRDWEAYPLGLEIKALIESNLTKDEIAGVVVIIHCIEKDAKNLYCGVYDGKSLKEAEKNFDYVLSLIKGYWYCTNEYNIIYNFKNSIVSDLLGEQQFLALMSAFANKGALDKYKKSYWYPAQFSRLLIKQTEDIETINKALRFACVMIDAVPDYAPDINLTAKAYEYNLISQELARYFILKSQYIGSLVMPSSTECIMRLDYKYQKFKTLLLDFVDSALEAEFSRGSLETQYSHLLARAERFYGVEKFCKAIVALRGITWVRSPFGTKKDNVFSYVLKYCVKAEGDDYDKFTQLVKEYKITDDELIKATLFNPEFVDYTAKYLGVPNLKIAVFWFIAHLNENLEESRQEKRIEQIKEFSDISYPDFKDGAFDCKWYQEMVDKVPKDMLSRVYDNAKYVTIGGLHKRAQRFFDALNGRIDKAECLEKMSGTRNKDYCLIYSLIPIENREDLFTRYNVLAEFIRSGKQFGAQRQLSERRTVDIAMENLARVAGYASSDIFIFEMEAENPSDIFNTITLDDIAITPYIDESKFKVSYSVQKNGKTLTSIPSKYGKAQAVVTMREEIKRLNQKFRRVIASLENTMNNRVAFTLEQLKRMRKERIMATALDKLIFVADGKLCVFDQELKSIDGTLIEANDIYVAHPVELKKLGLLQDAIEYVARHNIRQPFKQVMREIYTKTELELQQDEVLRFRGFEVDLKKCVSALKGKGWGVCEEIGLRKIYYRSDIVSAIFREFDLFYTADYTNVNRELHGIFFLKRKSGEIIPIKDVDDITFSETLRDVDLMVSISSKVIYDFDLAMSTVEMRQEVLKSIVAILGLNNVSFLKDNIKVQGKLGTYVVNIRTGLVFKEGKGNLALDTVYSVDKPILLDFVDEDPMTADIISKAIVLANDDAIKDTAILREIED
ncbi:MAG: DUF4132 domain-containing protein [Clostridia bacterium]|nr:DUF4132 domain-containing protein [Clostridia bacterium]